ncbi:MAG: hypothetical protein K9I29_02325 [Bacteroidales bacterium]|nr:hypothetical protein [Bacteroidales bacterium]MCF8327103.1 hypothetical protein [Bacteroidales bacterium]
MKRTTFILFVAIAFVFSSCSIFKGGSKSFEGKITYDISYPDADLEPAQKAQMPKQSVTYVMDNYAKTVRNMGMAEIVQIVDGEAKTKTIMVAGSGMKKYYTLSEEKIKAQNANIELIGVEKTDETKEIAGYTTKKAIAKYENDYGETETLTMYYTPEIGNKSINFDNPFMKEIDGMVLEYELKQGDMVTKYTAKSIEETNLKETDFLVPEDYEKLTDEELKQLRQAGQ